MKRKLISAVALILCATMFLFCGCKPKSNDETTVPPDTDAAIDNIIGDDTEPAPEDTTQSAQPAQSVRPAQQVLPTRPASKKPASTTQKPAQTVKPAPKPNTTTPQVEKPSNWKKAGKYTCDKDITAGIYYIKSNGNNCKVTLTNTKGDKKPVEFYPLSYGLFVEMRKGYVLEIENGQFISEREVKPMTSTTGVYKRGAYRIGEDIPAGEYVIGEFGNTDFSVLNSVDFLSGNNLAVTYENLRVYVKLAEGDYIIFNKDTKVVKAKDRTGSYDEKDKSYSGGTYLIGSGKDDNIKPGKYVLVPTDDKNGYSTGAAHVKAAKATGELNVKKDKSIIIELKDGQYISLEGFKLVEYVEPKPNPNPNPDPNPKPNPDGNNGGDNNKPNNDAGDNNKPNNNAGGDKADENKS